MRVGHQDLQFEATDELVKAGFILARNTLALAHLHQAEDDFEAVPFDPACARALGRATGATP